MSPSMPRRPPPAEPEETAATAARRRLRMAFVAVSYTPRRDGVSVYAENLLLQLLERSAARGLRLELEVFVCGEAAGVLRSLLREHCHGIEGAGAEGVRIIATTGEGAWERYVRVPALIRSRGPYDSVFVPNLQPLWLPRRRTVGVLHDLTYRVAREHFPRWRVRYMDLLTRLRLRADSGIACISRTTAGDLDRLYPAARRKERLHLPNGLPAKLAASPRPSPGAAEVKLTAAHPELLFVGRLNRLKGFDRVRRFCALLDEHCTAHGFDATVHVVGKDTPESAKLLRGPRLQRVRLLRHGYLDDHQLNELYRRSGWCLFLSRNEGFGLPVLEAIWQRCVPLLSDIDIFREVMGPGFPLFAGDRQSLTRLVGFVHRLRNDAAYRRGILERMEAVLGEWEGGYRRAADNLLDWALGGSARADRPEG